MIAGCQTRDVPSFVGMSTSTRIVNIVRVNVQGSVILNSDIIPLLFISTNKHFFIRWSVIYQRL